MKLLLTHCRVGLILALAFIAQFSSNATTATVRAVTGSPRVLAKNGWEILKPGDVIPAGAAVKTGLKERIDMAMEGNGRLVSVMPMSNVMLDAKDLTLHLREGDLIGSIRTSKEQAMGTIFVRSPLGITRIENGDFAISTVDKSVAVLSGKGISHRPGTSDKVARASDVARDTSIPMGNALLMANQQMAMSRMSPKSGDALLDNVNKLIVSSNGNGPNGARAAAGGGTISPEPYPNPGTGSSGYWANNTWPTNSLTVGGVVYTQATGQAVMNTAPKGDKTYNLFQELVAAKLNVYIQNDPTCVASTISAANTWITAHQPGSNVSSSDAAWVNEGAGYFTILNNYNMGLLCAPHRN